MPEYHTKNENRVFFEWANVTHIYEHDTNGYTLVYLNTGSFYLVDIDWEDAVEEYVKSRPGSQKQKS